MVYLGISSWLNDSTINYIDQAVFNYERNKMENRQEYNRGLDQAVKLLFSVSNCVNVAIHFVRKI